MLYATNSSEISASVTPKVA